ncbi:MAG: hypothetical protein ACLR56_08515 [Oscillospiraceae bacterium]
MKTEVRRGNKYDAVIMDLLRQRTDGEVWKLEQNRQALSDNAEFFFPFYTGFSPSILNYMVSRYVIKTAGHGYNR